MMRRSSGGSFMKGEVVDESVALSGSPCVFGAIVAGIVD